MLGLSARNGPFRGRPVARPFRAVCFRGACAGKACKTEKHKAPPAASQRRP